MGEGGQEGGGQWGGGISVMECLGGHTFPEQCRVTQLVWSMFQISALKPYYHEHEHSAARHDILH